MFDSDSKKNRIEYGENDIRPYPLRLHPTNDDVKSPKDAVLTTDANGNISQN